MKNEKWKMENEQIVGLDIKDRRTPYIAIAVLCLIIAGFRATIITEWPVYFHVIGYFMQVIAFIGIWELIMQINKTLERRFSFEKEPVLRIVVQVLMTILMLSPVFIITYFVVRPYLPHYIDNRIVTLLSMIVFMVLLLFNLSFYALGFFREWRQSIVEKSRLELKAAQSEKEKFLMQYHHLRNQVNPHFLFNTLTSLDGLIHSDPELASRFVRHLSKVYRYVLEHKETDVVSLETELDFIRHYISLLNIRYGNALTINISISDEALEKRIAMVTLQMLIDNAIKHNMVHAHSPLVIFIQEDGAFLSVKNNKQIRRQIEYSAQQGLQQLKQLYAFLSDTPVQVRDTGEYFEVKLPLL